LALSKINKALTVGLSDRDAVGHQRKVAFWLHFVQDWKMAAYVLLISIPVNLIANIIITLKASYTYVQPFAICDL